MKISFTKLTMGISWVFLVYLTPIVALAQSENESNSLKANEMKSLVSIFEIPAIDIARATTFYQEILDVKIERMDFSGMEMGIFPYEDQLVTGVIIKAEGYEPSTKGITLYLNAGDDLQIVLDRIEKLGGKIMVPKTPHADGIGYWAIFIDSEGNRLGLHSPN